VRIAIVSGDDYVGEDSTALCAALAVRGHDVTAYVRQPDRRPAKATDRGHRAVGIRVGPPVPSDPGALPFVGEWAGALERLWSSDHPDIVHANGWLGGLAAQLAARRHDLPTVQTFQGPVPGSRPRYAGGPSNKSERERIEPLLARNAAWVTVESSTDVQALARLRRGRARVSVLAGGVDVEQYTPVGPAVARTELHRALCLAPNPLSANGFDITIRAMPKAPGTELVVAETETSNPGHDKARAALKSLATELGVADRVHFVGTVAGDELPMLVRSADVVACTPRQPPRATSVLQAMASGVAVVALPVGVLVDLVVDSVTGLVLSTDNPNQLAAALRSLPAQRFRCQSMGAAGRSRALSRFSWDRIALDALNIYRQLSSQCPSTHPLQPTEAH
jgi:glycosyltransferase involved in cell wall biosynthesis